MLKKVLATAGLLMLAGSAAHAAPQLIFDNMSNFLNGVSGASATSTSSTPNTFMGDGYTLLSGATDITGFDFILTNGSGTNYTGIKGTIYVWGAVNTGTVSTTAPAFSNLLGTYTFTNTAAYTTGFYYPTQSATPGVTPAVSLTIPLVITSNTVGLTFNYQGTTDGTTYASANSLTSYITYGTAATVGSNVFNGFYRNSNSEVNGNFTSAAKTFGLTNQSLAVRVYGDVTAPEPSQYAAFGLGVLGLGALALKARRRSVLA